MTHSRTTFSRARRILSASLDQHLTSYATAAGAACIGMLAAPASEGKIVYTPTNVSMEGDSLSIDLDNDGVPDFEIVQFICGSHAWCDFVNPLASGNGIKGSRLGALAGAYGLPVGPKAQFLTQFYKITSTESAVGFMAEASAYGGQSFFSGGPWADTTNKYLGLKFLIGGKAHYGWARLSVKLSRNPAVILTGYAYETIPNHKILEGYTQGLNASTFSDANAQTSKPQLASLGMLARGVHGLVVWRRDYEIVAAV